MNLSGWQFMVLSPIFSVHWGLQKKKGRPTWRERQNSNNRKKFQHFKKEIFAKYNKDYLKEAKENMKMRSNISNLNLLKGIRDLSLLKEVLIRRNVCGGI